MYISIVLPELISLQCSLLTVEEQVLKVGLLAEGAGDILEEDGADNAATAPHEGNGGLQGHIRARAKSELELASRHQAEGKKKLTLFRDQLYSWKRENETFIELEARNRRLQPFDSPWRPRA